MSGAVKSMRVRPFYDDDMATALANVQSAGYEALFMPEIVDKRVVSRGNSRIWCDWFCAPSLRATGRW